MFGSTARPRRCSGLLLVIGRVTDTFRAVRRLARDLIDLLGLDGTQRGFEIGSGEGLVARALAPHCKMLDCADISRTFLDLAKDRCAPYRNVVFHLIGGEFLNFLPAQSYDFGYSLNVFVHLNVL